MVERPFFCYNIVERTQLKGWAYEYFEENHYIDIHLFF